MRRLDNYTADTLRFLMPEGHGACKVYRRGWSNALKSCGHEVFTFDPSIKPVFDAFSEVRPSAIFFGTYEIDRAFVKALAKHSECRVVLWGDHWGSMDSEIDWQKDPIGRATDAQKKMVEEVIASRAEKGLLPHVLSYYPQRFCERTHNGWRELGLEPVGLPLAADVIACPLSEPLDELRCDWVFVGGHWPYKSQNLRSFVYPLCHPDLGLAGKAFGPGDWPVSQRLGAISEDLLPRAYASALVSPCVYEPVIKYGADVSERIFKCVSSGGFPVSQRVEALEKDIFKDGEVVLVDTPKEMVEAVQHYSRSPEERIPYMVKAQRAVYENHTYHKRLFSLFTHLGMPEQAEKVGQVYEELLPRVWRPELRASNG